MKLKILILLLLLIVASWTHSSGAETAIGAIGGLTSYSFAGDKPSNGAYRSLTSGTFGAVCEFGLTEYVKLSLQPSWSRKGTKIAFKVSGQKERVDSVEVKLDYLSIPVLVKVFTNGKRFYVSSGLEYAYLLDAKYVTAAGEQDVKEDLESHDLSVIFGIGGTIPRDRFTVFIEARFTQSVINVVTQPENEGALDVRVKNRGLLLCAGVLFGL